MTTKTDSIEAAARTFARGHLIEMQRLSISSSTAKQEAGFAKLLTDFARSLESETAAELERHKKMLREAEAVTEHYAEKGFWTHDGVGVGADVYVPGTYGFKVAQEYLDKAQAYADAHADAGQGGDDDSAIQK